MNGFAMLWSKILESSLWVQESKETRLVWIAILAMKDADGIVQASVVGLADRAKVTLDECKEALRVLLSPDPNDTSKVDEGRRLREVPGGWLVVNHDLYRFSTEAKREFWRHTKAEQRKRANKTKPPSDNRLQNLQPWQLNLDIDRVKRLLADEQDRRNSNPDLCRSYYADLEALKAEKRRRAPPRKTVPKPMQKAEPRNGNIVTPKSLEELAKLKQAVK